jgi:hypothetical protein
MPIIDKNGRISDIEKMMKYCSKLSDIFGYPYYFNWSPPTNHRDDNPDGEIADISYAMFRCGKYAEHPNVRSAPAERQIMFGPVNMIVNNHRPMRIMVNDAGKNTIEINSFEDIENNIDAIKKNIDEYLHDLLVKAVNDSIDANNRDYAEFNKNNDKEPLQHITSL